jgi:hypothetical protein
VKEEVEEEEMEEEEEKEEEEVKVEEEGKVVEDIEKIISETKRFTKMMTTTTRKNSQT